jgi:hypothetical protein
MKLITVAYEINVSERVYNPPGSTGCQPVLFGSLPKSLSNVLCEDLLRGVRSRRQAADDNRLTACAPQATGNRHSL